MIYLHAPCMYFYSTPFSVWRYICTRIMALAKCLGARTVITKHLLKPITKSTWQHTPRLLPKGLERATSAVKDSKGCPDWERMNYEFTKTAKVYTKYVLMKNQYLPFHKKLVLIRLSLYSVNIVTSALHKSQVSWNIWPLSTKRGPMEKNSKIILNVASALLRVWRKYWFQKNDGNFYNNLNHFLGIIFWKCTICENILTSVTWSTDVQFVPTPP